MEEPIHYNNSVSCIYDNFIYTYYPATIFLADSLEIVDIVEQPNLFLYDVGIFNGLLSKDIVFNKAVFEVAFMYLSYESGDDNDESIDLILSEVNDLPFINIVGSERFERNKHVLTKDKIKFLMSNLFRLLYRAGYDIMVVGWERRMRNFSIGVLYV